MAEPKQVGSSLSPACRGVERVVVASQEIQLANNVVATGKPVCQRQVEVKRKLMNPSQMINRILTIMSILLSCQRKNTSPNL